MPVSRDQVLEVLRGVQDPDLHKDIVTLGFVKDVRVSGGEVDFTIELTTPACPVRDEMKAEAEQRVAALPGVKAWIDDALVENDFREFEEPYRTKR